MKFKSYVDWAIAAVVGVALGAAFAGPAHAEARNAEKLDLPAHRLQFSDSLDVVEDKSRGIVCYVVRQSDSHSTAMQCVPLKTL